jgi:2-phospho-L-lactate transferase/gluconeogenesis factor (CofD/UPF0052 family)
MKTYLLKIDDSQEEVILALIKALKIETEVFSESDEDTSLMMAMEEGKKYGRLSDEEGKKFLTDLGK